MKEKLVVIGIVFSLIAVVWGANKYFDRYALCADVKQQQQMNEYKFKSIDLRTINQQIFDLQKAFGVKPTNKEKAAELEKLMQEREGIKEEMKGLKGGEKK